MVSLAQRRARKTALTAVVAFALTVPFAVPAAASVVAPATASVPAAVTPAPLTNLTHLDFLLDEASPPAEVAGHSTYRQAEEPTLVLPWTYADARDGGTFERVGGGPLDPATGYWGQGAYNADDIARTAVVYLRHWTQTGDEASRQKAYELLRSVAYLQTTGGPSAGNVVLWMQPDGTLNPSAEPVELPDPSDSGPSYWTARTVWALGEGYAAFADSDPAFAAFLEERLNLSLGAIERDSLSKYGQWNESDGKRVPAWLIVNGADASAEAALGLAARVEARPDDTRAATALRQLAEGIAAMSSGTNQSWPYRAILPWAESPAMWHAWGSQMPAALAKASVALGDPSIAEPAVADAAVFTPTLLTAGGPDNGWYPSPTDRVQIAYGADSRVQSLLAVADATGSEGFASLAAIQASWFFGGNHAGAQMYDPATGVTYDGLQPDGTVNRNSGAESAIHGLLTALALDAHPAVAARATSVTSITARDGLEVVEAEDALSTAGTISTPESWTGESSWSGDALTLAKGQKATFDIGTDETRRWVEPVLFAEPGASSTSTWRAGGLLGRLDDTGPAQGISPTPGALLPHSLSQPAQAKRDEVTVEVQSGSLQLDTLLVRPWISRMTLEGSGGRTELVHSSATVPQPAKLGGSGTTVIRVYDDTGELQRERTVSKATTVSIPAGGFAIAER